MMTGQFATHYINPLTYFGGTFVSYSKPTSLIESVWMNEH